MSDENQNVENQSYEFNSIYSIDSVFIDCFDDLPIDLEKIKNLAKNPQQHIKELRKVSEWAYYKNGSIMSSVNYLKTMYTLDKVIYSKNKKVKYKKFENNREN